MNSPTPSSSYKGPFERVIDDDGTEFRRGEPSAPSRLNFRVGLLQLDPCFVNRELPIDGPLLLVDAF